MFVGEKDSLVTKCPSKFSRPTPAPAEWRPRPRLPDPRAGRSRSTASAPRSTARAARKRRWVESGRRAVYALAGVLTVAFAILESRFLRSDFSFGWSSTHSSTTTPPSTGRPRPGPRRRARCCCGSGCCRCGRASCCSARAQGACATSRPTRPRCCSAWAAFFLALLGLPGQPVRRRWPRAAEGAGLNPLLRHPSMMIHPPMLYSGYTLFAVPVRVRGRRAGQRGGWTPSGSRSTRRFALAAWFFLGVGILLGARWSYAELGWGGYWAWDPVENASLMPWLTGTAFLHSIDDPGEARDAEGLERLAGAGDRHPRHAGDVPGALGDPRLDPRLRRLDARRAVPRADRA